MPGKFRLALANLGDSRAVLLRASGDGETDATSGNTRLNLHFETVDHKPEDPNETRRIEQAGGKVGVHPDDKGQKPRVDLQLGCSRALGDFSYKEDPSLLP